MWRNLRLFACVCSLPPVAWSFTVYNQPQKAILFFRNRIAISIFFSSSGNWGILLHDYDYDGASGCIVYSHEPLQILHNNKAVYIVLCNKPWEGSQHGCGGFDLQYHVLSMTHRKNQKEDDRFILELNAWQYPEYLSVGTVWRRVYTVLCVRVAWSWWWCYIDIILSRVEWVKSALQHTTEPPTERSLLGLCDVTVIIQVRFTTVCILCVVLFLRCL